MANLYLTTAQFNMLFDQRVANQLSNDQNLNSQNATNLQFILDMAGSMIDSALNARYDITWPAGVPLFLSGLVFAKALGLLYNRRSLIPDSVAKMIEWGEDWLQKLIDYQVSIPGYSRGPVPVTVYSDSLTGRSVWDSVFNLPVSPTSTQGQAYEPP
jgi:phage gp36-like protein